MAEIRENKKKMQNLMQSMANAVLPILPSLWTRVVIGYFIEGEEEISHLQFHVMENGAGDYLDIMEASWEEDEYDEAIFEVQDVCKEVQKCCKAAGDQWTSMTFVLQRDGYFNAEYSYEPINNYDAMFIMNWQSDYLE